MLPTELAEIIVETLNNKSEYDFSQDFTAIHTYVPCWELKDLKELRVTVLVPALTTARHDRGKWISDVTVQIGVQKKLDISPDTNPVNAALLMTTEANIYQVVLFEISSVLRSNQQQGEAHFKSEELIPYDSEHLQGQNVYTGLLNLTYQMLRD